MDVAQVYALVAGSVFAILTVFNFCLRVSRIAYKLTVLFSRYVRYPFVLRRHRLLGPWTRWGLLLRLLYLGVNIFCSAFNVRSTSEASSRVGMLALINIIPLFLGPHLGHVASVLGLSLRTYRALHAAAAVMSMSLSIVHTILSVHHGQLQVLRFSGPQSDSGKKTFFGLVGICTFALVLLTSLRLFRRLSYEFFLRGHQSGGIVIAYTIWMHVWRQPGFAHLCLFTAAGIFAMNLGLECLITFYRNCSFRHGWARACVRLYHAQRRTTGGDVDGALESRGAGTIRISIKTPRPWRVRPGQYINVWLPGGSFRSWFESHPFMIASWDLDDDSTDSAPQILQLLVLPRSGFTRRLRMLAQDSESYDRLVVFGGPYGLTASMEGYANVLMVASGHGIAAHLPYLRALLDGYKASEVVTRRIHLVWRVDRIGDEMSVKDFIDQALLQDGNNWILHITIYFALDINQKPASEGEHGRISLRGGEPDCREILNHEVEGHYSRYIDGKQESWRDKPTGKILVAVSANDQMRDEWYEIIRDRRDLATVHFIDLEYQPS